MNFPVEINIWSIPVSLHLIFETLAFFIGFRYYTYLRNRTIDRINSSNRIWILIGAIFGAFIFSRVLGALENPSSLLGHDSKSFINLYTNKTIVGALLGGLLCVEITKKFLNEKSSSGDLFTYPLILGMIIGRIGCFTSGINEPTYGIASDLPWALNLGDGITRHPVALYEIFFLIVFWLTLKRTESKAELRDGIKFKLFMIFYLSLRFAIDFIKPVHFQFIHLSSIQIACLAGLVYYSRTIYFIIFRPSFLKESYA